MPQMTASTARRWMVRLARSSEENGCPGAAVEGGVACEIRGSDDWFDGMSPQAISPETKSALGNGTVVRRTPSSRSYTQMLQASLEREKRPEHSPIAVVEQAGPTAEFGHRTSFLRPDSPSPVDHAT